MLLDSCFGSEFSSGFRSIIVPIVSQNWFRVCLNRCLNKPEGSRQQWTVCRSDGGGNGDNRNLLTASIPQSCGMLLYRPITSNETRQVFSFTSYGRWLRKSRSSRMKLRMCLNLCMRVCVSSFIFRILYMFCELSSYLLIDRQFYYFYMCEA